jgi:hypothetical protein
MKQYDKQYCEIYPILKQVIGWLQEHYPHDTYFVIDSIGATMYHKRSVFAMDDDFFTVSKKEENKNGEGGQHEGGGIALERVSGEAEEAQGKKQVKTVCTSRVL